MEKDTEELEDTLDKPELIEQAEQLFFALQNNLTHEAKNTVWQLITKAKSHYGASEHKDRWNSILENLHRVIIDFENDLTEVSEIKLKGLEHNTNELLNKEQKDASEG